MKINQRKNPERCIKECVACGATIIKPKTYTYKQFDVIKTCSQKCKGVLISCRSPWNKGVKMWEGKIHPNKGKKFVCSEDTKKRISLANTGKIKTRECKYKISEKLRLKLPEEEIVNKYLTTKINSRQLADHYKCSIGAILYVLKRHNVKLENRWNEQSTKSIKEKSMERRRISPFYLLELRIRAINATNRPEVKLKMRNAKLGKKHPQWVIDKSAIKIREFYRNHPEVLKNNLKNFNLHPNKIEIIVTKILNECNLPYSYVGYGQIIIGTLNPDFIDEKGKKIIEVFGDYWHNLKGQREHRTEPGRIAYFRDYGYNTLVLWEKDIKRDIEKIKDRVLQFHNEPNSIINS